MNKLLNNYIVTKEFNIVQTMQKIDEGAKGIAFVVDSEEHLIGCVTDGDIRRWLIKTADLSVTIEDVMFKNPKYIYEAARRDSDKYMSTHSITALPVVNEDKKVIDIIFSNCSNVHDCKKNVKALNDVAVVIMAGGKGTRLYPYTKILPKPLIPIGDVPIIERIMSCFVDYGVSNFWLTVNYKKGMIKSYFDEMNPEYKVTYVEENKPLGTGGSLTLIKEKFDKPIFVTNCDILIEADLEDIYLHHIRSGNAITIVSSLKNVVIPYGVLEVKEEGIVREMREKPKMSYFINTGMYIINPELLEYIPQDTFYHMPQLAEECMSRGMKVGIYPISEDAFLDMGEIEELRRMEEKLSI